MSETYERKRRGGSILELRVNSKSKYIKKVIHTEIVYIKNDMFWKKLDTRKRFNKTSEKEKKSHVLFHASVIYKIKK